MNPGWEQFSRIVAAREDHPALLMGDLRLGFAELGLMARRYASGLAYLGAGPGDRVVLRLPNGPAALALPAAIWAVGAVPVLVPLDLRPEGLAEICARTEPRVILTDPVELGEEDPFDGAEPASLGSIVFISGSTGRPRGWVQRQMTLLEGASRVAEAVGFGAEDRVLSMVPWSHDYGWTQVLACYVLGLTLVVPSLPGLAGPHDAILRHRPTVLGGVPSSYATLATAISSLMPEDRASVRLIMSTGSVMPPKVWDGLGQLFPGVRRVLNYGLTETFRSATLRAEDEGLAPRVVGSALPGSALCVVVDEAGRVLPPGEWGEVVHRGAGVFERYWDDPGQTALRRRHDPVTGEGWAVFTGDRGMLDAAGRLTLGDRDRPHGQGDWPVRPPPMRLKRCCAPCRACRRRRWSADRMTFWGRNCMPCWWVARSRRSRRPAGRWPRMNGPGNFTCGQACP